MKETKTLVKGAGIYFVVNLITQASSFLLVPLYTRLLTPADYGILGLLSPILNSVPLFLIIGLYVAQMRLIPELKGSRKKIGSYIFTLNLFLWAINIPLVLLFSTNFIKTHFWNNLLNLGAVPHFLIALSLAIAFGKILSLMAQNYNQTVFNFKKIAVNALISFFSTTAVALTAIVIFDLGVTGKIIGIAAGTFFSIFFLYVPYFSKAKINPQFSKKALKESLNIGLPLALASLIGVASNSIDKYLINSFVSLEALGVYYLTFKLSTIVNFVITAYNSSWAPVFNKVMISDNADKYKYVKKQFTYFTLLLSGVSLIGQLFSKEVITLLLPDNFLDSINFLPYVLMALVFVGMNHFFKDILNYQKYTKIVPPLKLVFLTLAVLLNLFLIKSYGVMGAVWAYWLITLLDMLVHGFIIKMKFTRYKFDLKMIVLILLFPALALITNIHKLPIAPFSFLIKIIYILIFILVFNKIFCEATNFFLKMIKLKEKALQLFDTN